MKKNQVYMQNIKTCSGDDIKDNSWQSKKCDWETHNGITKIEKCELKKCLGKMCSSRIFDCSYKVYMDFTESKCD